ncbi:hypothetical protein M426DRAFT_15216 [Hypoxylon sp. CI-4A]|nr:hypothetical protein M426DRAFT_15216 [Hypoxylon sp. CI-4A]
MASGDDQPRGDPQDSPQEQQADDGQLRRRRRRRQRMPEDELRARRQRRSRFHGQASARDQDQQHEDEEKKNAEATGSGTQESTAEEVLSASEPAPMETEAPRERKPWETLIIDDLGENLSFIEEKNREIERHQYIVNYYKEHSPDQVAHNQRILDQNQREEKNRVGERLEMLDWALDTCQCEAEEVNIRAAIQGYQSGDIPYSQNYTLIYGGHIVDSCPTYQSFCEDRQERLDQYFAAFGPGWLWHEPPLSETGPGPMANKSLCLNRQRNRYNYNIGYYAVAMEFSLDQSKVCRLSPESFRSARDSERPFESGYKVRLRTILDSGATYPVIPYHDLKYLDIDMRRYASQGITSLSSVTDISLFRFFEMNVSVIKDRDEHGQLVKTGNGYEQLVGGSDQATWPGEPRRIGAMVPVCLDHNKVNQSNVSDRLSGMLPFDACYISSVPTAGKMWLGEDRRDVLGASRMPPHRRFDTEKTLRVEIPSEFERARLETKTPDQVLFIHNLPGPGRPALMDADWPSVRGKSELSIVKTERDQSTQRTTRKVTSKAILEPRTGKYVIDATDKAWEDDYLEEGDFFDPKYKTTIDPIQPEILPPKEGPSNWRGGSSDQFW